MSQLILNNVEERFISQLQERAAKNHSTPEEEAKALLVQALQTPNAGSWEEADRIYNRLSKMGRSPSDSALLIREDRDR